MFKKDDIVEIRIDSLTYGGDGLGKIDNYAVFVPDTAPGDLVKAQIISSKKSYAKALLLKIIEPSKCRIKPECPLTKVCGGCQWQYIDYNEQLKIKKQIVKETLDKTSSLDIPVNDVIASDIQREYRCKIQYPIQQTKVSKKFLAGYYKKASHKLVNIKYCPAQPAIIDEITQYFRYKAQELNLKAYNETKHKGIIRHLVYRVSYTQKNITLTVVVNSNKITNSLKDLCENIYNKFDGIKGVTVNFNTSKSNVIQGRDYQLICGDDFTLEELENENKKIIFKISSASFFQVNISTAVKMFNYVRDIVKNNTKNPSILDVYAGVGSFTFWLEDLASDITAIEDSPNAVKDALENIKLNNINPKKINYLQGNADSRLEQLTKENKKYDIVILDPPRKGCSQTALNAVKQLTDKYIIYVSCNPATLARDLKYLNEFGFTPEFAQPVDMFCHTYHIESIVLLKKLS